MTAEAVLARAQAAYGAGKDAAAEAAAREVLAMVPGHAGARHLLAACRIAAGAPDEGGTLLEGLLAEAPGHDAVRLQLAELRARQGRHQAVVALLEDTVRARPGFLPACRALAAAQWETGARDAAIAIWRNYVAQAPQDGAAALALGDAVRLHGEPAEAVPLLRRAAAMLARDRARLMQARLGLAEALMALAIARATGAAAREAAREEAASLGLALWNEGPWDAATCERLGIVLHRTGELKAAAACYGAMLSQGPGTWQARLNLAMLQLSEGNFAEGWRGYEERRRHLSQLGPFQAARADGPWIAPADLHGQTVRVVLEQGLGDTLHFVRYLGLLAGRGARVEVAMPIQASLRPLLAAMPEVAAIVDAADTAPVPGRQVAGEVVPLLSLPLAFGTDAASIPAKVPYLTVPGPEREVWRRRLAGDAGRRRVGVVWAGNPDYPNDHERSIPLALFRRVLARADLDFHVLADKLRPGDAALLGRGVAVHDGIASFADTAALAAEMDLVIAVDTAVAHLAGGLGRSVWVLLPYDADWRWCLGRDDSPWYPTARLFRQSARGDWDGVLARVSEALDATFR